MWSNQYCAKHICSHHEAIYAHFRTQTLRRERILWAVHIVNEKFKYFVTLLDKNCIMDKCDAVDFLCKIYNKKSNIEWVSVHVLDNIVTVWKVHVHFYRKQVFKIRFEIN